MRSYLLPGVFTLLFLLPGSASAEDARSILDRAIQAHGGAARLERTKKGHIKAQIDAHLWNADFKIECEEIFDLPARYWRTVNGKSADTSFHLEYAITGKKGWVQEGTEPARDISVREPPTVARQWHAVLAMLLLLREKDVQLKKLPDDTKEGHVFLGFHATSSSQGSADLYFDKSTGLLARTQRPVQDLLSYGDASSKTIYDDYRDIQGVQFPMRFQAVTGKNTSRVTISSLEFFDKIDDSVFVKPQTPADEDDEKRPALRDRMLILATLGTGIVIGALWYIVRGAKQGRRQTPPG